MNGDCEHGYALKGNCIACLRAEVKQLQASLSDCVHAKTLTESDRDNAKSETSIPLHIDAVPWDPAGACKVFWREAEKSIDNWLTERPEDREFLAARLEAKVEEIRSKT